MAKGKDDDAKRLTLAATTHEVNTLTEQNDARERACLERGGGLPPLELLERKLEAYFKVALGDARYMQYMLDYQKTRAGLLDMLEQALREYELTQGLSALQLPPSAA